MEVFGSNNYNDENVSYLKFSSEFNIKLSEKIKIILGPNGIGKTSIYKNIKERHSDYSYIDYDEIRNSVIAKGDKLIIAPSIAEIVAKENEIEKIINSLDISKIMKENFKISNKAKSDVISNEMNSYRTNSNDAIKKFDGNKLDILINLDEKIKEILINYGGKIFNIVNEEIELDKIKKNYKKRYLELIEKSLSETETKCPICDNINDIPIKQIIEKKLNNIKDMNDGVVKDYVFNNPNLTSEEILKKLEELKQKIISEKISVSDLEDYLICGGSKENANLIIDAKKKLAIIAKELEELKIKKEEFYKNTKEIKDSVIEIFKNQLNTSIENINFNDEEREVEIKLSRQVVKYSTGEINLITFMVSLLEFIGSDKNTLIIDDPLSSYDIPNQYKIIYEITNAKRSANHILLFTHNIDCINIANSQKSNIYEYEIIDKINGKLYLNKIENALEDSGYSIGHILKHIGDYKYKKYLELLVEKDNWKSNCEYHKIFHYDSSYSKEINGIVYKNDELVELIDKLKIDSMNNINYLINSANKIMFLSALKVWIEKKFTENTNDLEGLMKKNKLADKIIYMFDGNHWTGTNKVTKSYLMSKKVMLNQNEHSKSQKEPFYYALSLSTEEIVKEIIDIKEHFKA